MAYRNAVYDSRNGTIGLFTWDENGERIMRECSFEPYLYVEDPHGSARSIFGTKLKKKTFSSGFNRYKFVKDTSNKRLFENLPPVQQFLLDLYWKDNESDDFAKHPLKVCFYDIETYDPPYYSSRHMVTVREVKDHSVTVQTDCSNLNKFVDTHEVYDEEREEWVEVNVSCYKRRRRYNDFPNPEDPKHPINVITCWDNFSSKYNVFGTGEYTGAGSDDVVYNYYETEEGMLEGFLKYIEDDHPDVMLAWNGDFFDTPYIVNRIQRIMSKEDCDRLSPLHNVYFTTRQGKFGNVEKKYHISGMSSLDYLNVYQRFCLKLRESYKLDAIGEVELGENKIDYGDMSLAQLADTDWNKFVDYNIQDVKLLVDLEDKLQYIPLLRMLAYIGTTTLDGAMGTLQVITGALTIRARHRGEIISTFKRDDVEGKNPGAYVSQPKTGFKTDVVSYDANSLYPNVMISLNTSPETKVGKIISQTPTSVTIQHVTGKEFDMSKSDFSKFIAEAQCTVSKAGCLFTQKKKGIIPEFLEYYYAKRVEAKKKMLKARDTINKLNLQLESCDIEDRDDILKQIKKQKAIEFDMNTLQMTQKIMVNSAYGLMGNKKAAVGDDDIASSVTLTGQAVIKQSNELIKEYIKSKVSDISDEALEECIIYNDTDSSYVTLKPLVDKGILKLVEGGKVCDDAYEILEDVENYINTNINKWARKSLLTRDSRFVFKRECIADVGLFLQKKRYVMHILNDEGIDVDKFKYTGVEVVRTTMPNAIKPYAKDIIETMILTQDRSKTNKILNETYEVFKSLSPEEFAFVMGVKEYGKYAPQCNGFETCKRMPIHVKSAYYYNTLLDKLDTGSKYEMIGSGDKVRYFYVETPNKYGIETVGFKYDYPEEFKDIFKPDYDKMFNKILFNSIERFYENVSWPIRRPTENVTVELFDLFAK